MKKVIVFLFLIFSLCVNKGDDIDPSEIRVEVLNASGRKFLARFISMELRKRGFDVVRFDNADSLLKETVIFDRRDPQKKYGRVLGRNIKCNRVIFEADPLKICDVTLIIGKDYKRFFPDIEKLWR